MARLADARATLLQAQAIAHASDDVRLACTTGANLLLLGRASQLDQTLRPLLTILRQPIAAWRPGMPLVLPTTASAGTLLLWEVGCLTDDDQRRVEGWAATIGNARHIVSTTTRPLLSRVVAGAYSDRLFYRLNTVFVDLRT